MKITSIKTKKVYPRAMGLTELLDRYVKRLPERSILVITSKIVSLCEGNVRLLAEDKDTLVQKQADYFLPRKESLYNAALTITHSAFISSAGIDESNAAGHFVLLPRDAQKTAVDVRRYLKKRFHLKKIGVIITDSRSIPLRRGALGVALAWSGFQAIKDYRGKKDIFGRKMKYEVANIADALATAAVVIMGEGNEQTPLALARNIPFVDFVDRAPTKRERRFFMLDPKNDLFAPLFNFKRLKSGGFRE